MSAWQPIATAPKSTAVGSSVRGVYLLVFCPDEGAEPEACICVGWWEPLWPDAKGDPRGRWQGEADYELRPTHWMPLPAPPDAPSPIETAERAVIEAVREWMKFEGDSISETSLRRAMTTLDQIGDAEAAQKEVGR